MMKGMTAKGRIAKKTKPISLNQTSKSAIRDLATAQKAAIPATTLKRAITTKVKLATLRAARKTKLNRPKISPSQESRRATKGQAMVQRALIRGTIPKMGITMKAVISTHRTVKRTKIISSFG